MTYSSELQVGQEDISSIPLSSLQRVGKKTEEVLYKRGISSVLSLLFTFPKTYVRYDYQLKSYGEKTKIDIAAIIHSRPILKRFNGKTLIACSILVEGEIFTLQIWNQPYLYSKLNFEQEIRIKGTYDPQKRTITAQNIRYALGNTEVEVPSSENGQIDPYYAIGNEVKQHIFKSLMKEAYEVYSSFIRDLLPEELRKRYNLHPLQETIHTIHFPKDMNTLEKAKEEMKIREALSFYMKLRMKQTTEEFHRLRIRTKQNNSIQDFITELPYTLTHDQKHVIQTLHLEFQSKRTVRRLLQGDVGSGKTIVALAYIYLSIFQTNEQAVIMAPTEILAEQLYEEAQNILSPFGMTVCFLSSSLKARVKKENYEGIQSGSYNLVVGTHAVFTKDVEFQNLTTVVIDEQHRFGVLQRETLLSKGVEDSDVLYMTATPIPRTLTLTTFGDLDCSYLREKPQGRKPIQTYFFNTKEKRTALTYVQDALDRFENVYVVCPLVEESENFNYSNVIETYENFKRYFSKNEVFLLHGKQKQNEKEENIEAFRKGKGCLLVATTVVEVGVNVPHASTILIIDVERFGLSTLHQLRGRVGRSDMQSYCLLTGKPTSVTAQKRVEAMLQTQDGFVLSELDLDLRGPGDYFGTEQSGLPQFTFLDLAQDRELFSEIKNTIFNLSEETFTGVSYEQYKQTLSIDVLN